MTRAVSCGVLVTDGTHLLLGHATGSKRWDIPKGMADAGEPVEAAARRELTEETGLAAPAEALAALGLFHYRPGKDLALFLWRVPTMPDPATLHCSSTFERYGRSFPEFDRFLCPAWEAALGKVAPALRATIQAAFPHPSA